MSDFDSTRSQRRLQALSLPSNQKRFWARVQRCLHGHPCQECCWLWMGRLDKRHHGDIGMFRYGDAGRRYYYGASRVSWFLTHGSLPDDLFVLHNCPTGDNPRCVNPSHLWLGTQKQNIQDAQHKGRLATGLRHGRSTHPEAIQRGEAHHRAKLRTEQIADIRYLASHHMPHRLLAEIYEVDRSLIGFIASKKIWKHVGVEEGEAR